jgi:predicted phosphodiesterase
MRILCLADLHQPPDGGEEIFLHNLRKVLRKAGRIDLVLLAGDTLESSVQDTPPLPWRNPYGIIAEWFPKVPVIFVLGNHECFGRSVAETLAMYRQEYDPERWDVHCLDIVGHRDLSNGLRIVGNALWYDGSLAFDPAQKLLDYAGNSWPDWCIRDFDPVVEHRRCVDAIHEHFDSALDTILLTHAVPHGNLNGHAPSEWSAYAGCSDLLTDLPMVSWAVHGHTHRRDVGQTIHGCRCINPGGFRESHSNWHVIEP